MSAGLDRLAAQRVGQRPDWPMAFSWAISRVELGLRDDLDHEEHLRVVGAAELGALALERADLRSGMSWNLLVRPGSMSIFCRKAGTQNEWMTSRAVSTNSTRLSTGR